MDTGPVPEQFGVVLVLDPAESLDLVRVRDLLDGRVRDIPRLRQRLVRVPFGCGGPIWVDDPDFDIGNHVTQTWCTAPGDEEALAATALSAVMAPLPRDRPLWGACLVNGLAGGRVALVVTLHHVISDGVGGLAVLAGLVDPGPVPGTAGPRFPQARPGLTALARDAVARKVRALLRVRRSWQLLRASFGAGGGLRPPRITDCSLMRRTGPRRRLTVVRVGREPLRLAAHRRGATTNDAVLVTVSGALATVLSARGEQVDTIVVTVPVSGRGTDDGADLGNLVSPLLVPVPVTGDVDARLTTLAALVRAGKAAATGPPPIAVLGWLFRPLAALGGYRWYLNHQHRFHTLVSHLRGPQDRLDFAGAPIVSAIPIGVAEGGNVTAYFAVLSYTDTITITAVVDPDHFPDLDRLTDGLRAELDEIVQPRRRVPLGSRHGSDP
jgi:diacylglycerol O-acyltransferase